MYAIPVHDARTKVRLLRRLGSASSVQIGNCVVVRSIGCGVAYVHLADRPNDGIQCACVLDALLVAWEVGWRAMTGRRPHTLSVRTLFAQIKKEVLG